MLGHAVFKTGDLVFLEMRLRKAVSWRCEMAVCFLELHIVLMDK